MCNTISNYLDANMLNNVICWDGGPCKSKKILRSAQSNKVGKEIVPFVILNAMKNLLNHGCELCKSKKSLRSAQNDNGFSMP